MCVNLCSNGPTATPVHIRMLTSVGLITGHNSMELDICASAAACISKIRTPLFYFYNFSKCFVNFNENYTIQYDDDDLRCA